MPLKLATLLDSNAGAPLHPFVKEALFAFLNVAPSVGNPSSTHAFGRDAATLIANAERSILRTFRASPTEWRVTFTAGGTEANQLAIRSVNPSVWAVSEVEHNCILDLIPEMRGAGTDVRTLKPNAKGEVQGIAEATMGAELLSVIGVGNETGILQHILTSHILSGMKPETRPKIHVDYVAGWGKSELDLSKPGAPDLVAIAGHKLGGLSGVGALVHRKSIPVRRAGTPNLAGIVALQAVADHWSDVIGEIDQLGSIRDAFEGDLRARFPNVSVTGADLPRAPNVSNFSFTGLSKNLSLVAQLDLRGFAVSAGSACASQAPEPSHVLRAMGLSTMDARNALRVSLHPGNTADDLRGLLDALAEILKRHETR